MDVSVIETASSYRQKTRIAKCHYLENSMKSHGNRRQTQRHHRSQKGPAARGEGDGQLSTV